MQAAKHRCDVARAIADEDRAAIARYNAGAADDLRLRPELGAAPFDGDVERAPVVMLLGSPGYDETSEPEDHAFHRDGWPLGALHPDAPPGLRLRWHARLAALVDAFGAQHIANSVLALHITPWASRRFDPSLRLPSRPRMLRIARDVARRGAFVMVLRAEELWTEHPDIAAVPPSRRTHARSWRATHVHPDNIGDEAWSAVCRRVEVHRWPMRRAS